MTRVEKIRKNQKNNNIKTAIITLVLIVIVIMGIIFEKTKPLTMDNAKHNENYNFNVVLSGKIIYRNNQYFLHVITENNEVIIVSSKDEDDLMSLLYATQNNKVNVMGVLKKLPDKLAQDFRENYKATNMKTYDYILSVETKFDKYLTVWVILFILPIFLISRLYTYRKSYSAIDFLEYSNYNTKEANLKIGKYIEIVDNYLIETKYGTFIDLSLYDEFKIIEQKMYFIFTINLILNCFSKRNKNESFNLSKISKQEQEELLNYLYSVSKK